MLSDKLITLLASFSKVELNRFRKFLTSPYLNDQPETVRLFDWIVGQTKAFETLTKSAAWQALYPDRPFDDGHLRRLASELNQLGLRFLVAEARQNEPVSELLEMQKAMEAPVLKKHLAGVERQIEKYFEEHEGQSTELFLAQFQMRQNIFARASRVVSTTGYIEKLAPADFYLECFYLTQKLKYFIAWMQYSGMRTTEKHVPLIPGFWEYLEQDRFREVALIVVYKKVVQCFSEPENETHFERLVEDLNTYQVQLTEENLRECYHMAQNYCALKINRGRTDYYLIYFNLQKKLVELNMLLENGALSEGVFKNMITIGLSIGEFAWTEAFINDYYPYLPSNIRENARTFNLANLYLHQKKHDKVIELLSNVEYSDLVYALGAKLLLLRTYYESDEPLALNSLMDSFRIFVRRNKLMSKSLKREYVNFLTALSNISNAKADKQKNLARLRMKVSENQHIISKKWLLEKINELEKK